MSIGPRDLRVDTFRAGGKGGQNQNKRDTGVRITHVASGASAESRTYRTQPENKLAAFQRLVKTDRLRQWIHDETFALTISEAVDKAMHPSNLVVEGQVDGTWTQI